MSKLVLITGAAGGIGQATARRFAHAGWRVAITDVQSSALAALGSQLGDQLAVSLTLDVGDTVAVEAALKSIAGQNGGRLDLLVNNAWAGYEAHEFATFTAPFWEQPLEERWRAMFEGGVRTHFVASRHAAALMRERRAGLIISTVAWAFGAYLGNLFYDVAKAAIIRMVFGMATELRPDNVAAVALAPGFMRTERVLAAHEAQPFDLSATESPEYLGRAVLYLAADPDVLASKTGQVLTVGNLAREYGFHDIDGSQPEPFRLPVSG